MLKTKILTVAALLLLCLSIVPVTVYGTKPEKLVEIAPFEKEYNGVLVKGKQKVTVIIYDSTTVFDVSLTAVVTRRCYIDGELVGTVKVSVHYRGTITSPLGGELITGKMTYSLSSTGQADDDIGDGHWVIWYEDGEVVRDIGSGNLWFP